jgi:FkbM family methyltransferase
MPNVFPNPFIDYQCKLLEIEPALIQTNIHETYGQCNEDLIVEAVLRAQILRHGRKMNSIRYIEIGANHPIQTSGTYLLYKNYGATGVLIEPIPILAEKLKRIRPNDIVISCIITNSNAEKVNLHVHEKSELSSIAADHIARFKQFGGTEKITETIVCKNMHINDFMKRYGSGSVDYLSIDIEGFDMDVLDAMDPSFQPTIIQCEHEGRVEQFSQILSKRGYGLLAMTDVNIIFINKEAV